VQVSAVILAGGASRRMGRPKQLLLVDGRPMLLHVVDAALQARLAQVIVVLGSNAGEIAPELRDRPATIVVNPGWQEGMSSSLRAGLAAVLPDSSAALFIPADMPRLSPGVLQTIVAHFQESYVQTSGSQQPHGGIVIPTYQGRRGNPVLIARSFFPELMALSGDTGGRAIVAAHPADVAEIEVNDNSILLDVDTPADYEASVV
jgi:molybdenum cofactor cytidylyltransferase